jgi:CBS domain-containing protein
MTANFKSIKSNALAIDAAEIMEKNKIFSLVVDSESSKGDSIGLITYASTSRSRDNLNKEMSKRYKILSIIVGFLYFPILISKESASFQNISIQSDKVTIDEENRQLAFENNIRIKIDGYIIKGSDALLSNKDKKLEIYGQASNH